jgi:hypothetical protein
MEIKTVNDSIKGMNFGGTERTPSPDSWEGASFRWDFARKMINKINGEKPVSELVGFSRDAKYSLIQRPEEDVDPDSGLYVDFRQLDGTRVFISAKEQSGLRIIEDVKILGENNRELFRLSSLIPSGYSVIEGAASARSFMHPGQKIIVLERGFMESIGGRLGAVHEIGHGRDYSSHPISREELLGNFKGIASREREERAWVEVNLMMTEMESRGVGWIPKSFISSRMDSFIQLAIQNHTYPSAQ